MLHFSTVEQKPTIIIMMAKIAQRSEREIVRLTLWESMLVTSVSHPLMISVGKLGFLSLFGRWVWKQCHQRSDDDTITIKTVPLWREYAVVATWKIFSRGLIFKLCVQSNLPLASWHYRLDHSKIVWKNNDSKNLKALKHKIPILNLNQVL